MLEAKLALKSSSNHRSVIALSDSVMVGGDNILIIAGPCSVESEEQMDEVASKLALAPVQVIRGGAFKPRTSPYSFQGLGAEGLEILSSIRKRHGMPVVTEVMSIEQIAQAARHADILQVGSRNMQNFELLKALGSAERTVILKRGLAATIEEFILAAEYILSQGNSRVILCERGIRSFDSYTRNVLDLGCIVALKQLTHLPVIADPSHAAGKRELVADLSRAAIACGADGIMVECHPNPELSVSDARQALSLEDMKALIESLHPIAHAVGRTMSDRRQSGLALVAGAKAKLAAKQLPCRPAARSSRL